MSRGVLSIILAGGEGKRMGRGVPKVLLDLFGRPLVGHVIDALRPLHPQKIVVVGGRHLPRIQDSLGQEPAIAFAHQETPLGTAHAVQMALPQIAHAGFDVFILCGDIPLISTASLQRALETHRAGGADVTVVTAVVQNPHGLGRILRDENGHVQAIVEEKDASESERAISEINTGGFIVRAEILHEAIQSIGNDNAQREFYLTDLVACARPRVLASAVFDPSEARGVNQPEEWSEVRALMRQRIHASLRESGAVLLEPELSYIEAQVSVGEGTIIQPFSVIRTGVKIGCRARIGPFAHLRPGTVIEDDVVIGDFVEIKNSTIGAGSKAAHLAFLGDAILGRGVNVGAGAVTANFDGETMQPTRIADGVSLGAGTVLVAPVALGEGARTGANAVVLAGETVLPHTTVVGVPARPLPPRDDETNSPRA